MSRSRGPTGRLGGLAEQVAVAVTARIIEGLDVNTIVQRLDVNAIIHQVDINELIGRLDVNELVARLDVNEIAARLDVDEIAARLDVEALVERVDIDAVAARLDLDALLARLDVADLVQRAGVPQLVAQSTGQFADSAIDLVRRPVLALDTMASRMAFGATRRSLTTMPGAPPTLADLPAQEPGLTPRQQARARLRVSGRYAGPLSRLLAFLLDYLVVTSSLVLVTALIGYAVRVVSGIQLEAVRGDFTTDVAASVATLALWMFAYWWLSLSIAGRTVGMWLFGLSVVRRDGRPLSSSRAAGRVVVMPLSFALLGLGLLGALFDSRRRTWHDAIAGTAVVYNLGDRPRELPDPLTAWLRRHGADP